MSHFKVASMTLKLRCVIVCCNQMTRNEAMLDLSLLFRSHASFNSFVEIANRQNEGGHAIQIHVRVFWAKKNFMSSVPDIDNLSICDKSSIFYLTQLVGWAPLCPKYDNY